MLIGIVGVPRNEPIGAEIGYGIQADQWGKGFATEALTLFIEHYWSAESVAYLHQCPLGCELKIC
jgi:RimJ/RimL family protein N-acetyltransferase